MKKYFIELNCKVIKDYTYLAPAVRAYNDLIATKDLDENIVRLWDRAGHIAVENERLPIAKAEQMVKGYIK